MHRRKGLRRLPSGLPPDKLRLTNFSSQKNSVNLENSVIPSKFSDGRPITNDLSSRLANVQPDELHGPAFRNLDLHDRIAVGIGAGLDNGGIRRSRPGLQAG